MWGHAEVFSWRSNKRRTQTIRTRTPGEKGRRNMRHKQKRKLQSRLSLYSNTPRTYTVLERVLNETCLTFLYQSSRPLATKYQPRSRRRHCCSAYAVTLPRSSPPIQLIGLHTSTQVGVHCRFNKEVAVLFVSENIGTAFSHPQSSTVSLDEFEFQRNTFSFCISTGA